MSRLTRHTLFTVATILAPALFTTRTEAQTQVVKVTLVVPFTLRNLHPEIKEIALNCQIFGANSPPQLQPSWRQIPSYQPTTPGTFEGTLTQSVNATVPADSGGKGGSYSCSLQGRTATGTMGYLSPGAVDLRFKVLSPSSVGGTFVW